MEPKKPMGDVDDLIFQDAVSYTHLTLPTTNFV